jgi:hypothetical protein
MIVLICFIQIDFFWQQLPPLCEFYKANVERNHEDQKDEDENFLKPNTSFIDM